MVDAYTLFLHARSAVTAAHYPRRIDYIIAVSGIDGQAPRTAHYRASSDTFTGEIRVFPISDEELSAPPPVPHGFNYSFSAGLYGSAVEIPIGPQPPAFDLLGVPKLTPSYSFGLMFPLLKLTTAESDSSPLPTIAVVSTRTRDYDVTLIDTPDIDGTLTYHLHLTPLRRAKDNRLRELWIGSTDYLPRKAIVGGNFTLAPLVDVPWTIDFAVRGGAPYVARETAATTLYMPHRHVVRDAQIDFEDVGESDGTLLHRPLIEEEATDTTLVEP